MILVYDTPGQLGNQLWAYSNMMAIAKEGKNSLIVILKNDYYTLLDKEALKFAATNKIFIYSSNELKSKLIKRVSAFFTSNSDNKNPFIRFLSKRVPITVIKNLFCEERFINMKKKGRAFIVNSWEQRTNKKSFIAHSDYIRSIILPDIEHRRNANKKIILLRQSNDIIVGVHIRRGDYKNFENGKYYYEDKIYLSYMKQIENLFNSKKVVFIIFSNERINMDNFSEVKTFFDPDKPAIEDMWAMSLCNYIIGPVSTFSMWASFWHKAPLFIITNPERALFTGSFKNIIAHDFFNDYTYWYHNS